MSTRSAILMKVYDGYVGIYCHFDGYLEGVGKKLLNYYNDKEKAKALISLGHISSLGKTLKETEAYHRDKGEELKHEVGITDKDVYDKIGHNGYIYIYEDNEWYVILEYARNPWKKYELLYALEHLGEIIEE